MEELVISVVDNDVYSAWCYPTKSLIQHKWHQYCFGDVFRSNMTKAMDAFEKYNCTKWLSDDRDFAGALHPDDWKWGEVYFTDRLVPKGWKYSAMVLPATGLAKISTTALINYFASKGLEARFFSDFNEAKKWILEQ